MLHLGKKDIILIAGILFFALACLFVVRFFVEKKGTKVEITVDGTNFGTYDLNKNQTIPIKVNGKVTNTLSIFDGAANMKKANCPDKLCMHQKEISQEGETIVCLPNKIVVTVIGKTEKAYDSITK